MIAKETALRQHRRSLAAETAVILSTAKDLPQSRKAAQILRSAQDDGHRGSARRRTPIRVIRAIRGSTQSTRRIRPGLDETT